MSLEFSPAGLVIRLAHEADSRAIWEINRQPSVRQAAFSQDEILWGPHQKWFSKALQDPNRLFLVGCVEQNLVGVVRLDLMRPALLEITVALAESYRGRGLGRTMILRSSLMGFELRPSAERIRAYVKPGNTKSQKAFEASGYQCEGESLVRKFRVLEYSLRPGMIRLDFARPAPGTVCDVAERNGCDGRG